MSDNVKKFLKQYGPLLVDKADDFWTHARSELNFVCFEELIGIFNKQGLKIEHGEHNQKILHYVKQYVESPFTDPPAAYASMFTEGPYRCSDHRDEVANTCLLSKTYKVYETYSPITGEIDFLILLSHYSLSKYVKVMIETIEDQTGTKPDLNTSMFREMTKPI